jgi:hypothetical protein
MLEAWKGGSYEAPVETAPRRRAVMLALLAACPLLAGAAAWSGPSAPAGAAAAVPASSQGEPVTAAAGELLAASQAGPMTTTANCPDASRGGSVSIPELKGRGAREEEAGDDPLAGTWRG